MRLTAILSILSAGAGVIMWWLNNKEKRKKNRLKNEMRRALAEGDDVRVAQLELELRCL